MKEIKEISSIDTFLVRHTVLREGKPIETCQFDGDDLETTVHFGLFINENIIGVVSVFKNDSIIFNTENQYQIRGMGVLHDFQKRGYGEMLVKHLEKYVKINFGQLIWFNARENAVPFYEKLGYTKIGAPFSIADIGPHYIMKKEIG